MTDKTQGCGGSGIIDLEDPPGSGEIYNKPCPGCEDCKPDSHCIDHLYGEEHNRCLKCNHQKCGTCGGSGVLLDQPATLPHEQGRPCPGCPDCPAQYADPPELLDDPKCGTCGGTDKPLMIVKGELSYLCVDWWHTGGVPKPPDKCPQCGSDDPEEAELRPCDITENCGHRCNDSFHDTDRTPKPPHCEKCGGRLVLCPKCCTHAPLTGNQPNCAPPKPPASSDEAYKIRAALAFALRYGGIEGNHHRAWTIDQMVRELTGDGYAEWVRQAKEGDDGPDTYGWDEGIAP